MARAALPDGGVSGALRRALAGPTYAAWRILRAFRRDISGLRIVVLHGTPDESLSALDRLIVTIKRGHDLVTPDQAAARFIDTNANRRPACLLSFDDGFASNHRAAHEVLARHGVKALFFVCPNLIDLDGVAQSRRVVETVFDGHGERMPANERLMTWAELAELKTAGHVIAAHGLTHRRLSGLAGSEREREINGSGDAIAARLGGTVDWFAYPFGDIDSISAEALSVVGKRYGLCRSGIRGDNRADTHRLAIRAEPVDLAMPLAYQRLELEGGLDGRYADAREKLDTFARTAKA